jgi:hypothetical protein
MLDKAIPDAAVLRQLLRYEPETGKLFWLPRPREMFKTKRAFSTWNAQNSGNEAFSRVAPMGYKMGAIFDKVQYAHRIIWVMHFGEVPKSHCLDHIDGDKLNNKISNMRLVTRQQNCFNSAAKKSGTGKKGVCLCKRTMKWTARIQVSGVVKNLGRFDSVEEAGDAYLAAAQEYHGQFAVHNRPNL